MKNTVKGNREFVIGSNIKYDNDIGNVEENAGDLLEALYLLVDIDLEDGGEYLNENTTVRIRSLLRKHGMLYD